jgi:excisionase family DNA binding protein
MATKSELVTMSEAAQILGVSSTTMWRLVRDGVMPTHQDPLDRRSKLIDRADLERLMAQSRSSRQFQSDGIDMEPVDTPSDRIKDWVRQTWHTERGS